MPKGTRVHRCVDKVKKSGRGVNPYAVCQASTDQSYATGKTLKETNEPTEEDDPTEDDDPTEKNLKDIRKKQKKSAKAKSKNFQAWRKRQPKVKNDHTEYKRLGMYLYEKVKAPAQEIEEIVTVINALAKPVAKFVAGKLVKGGVKKRKENRNTNGDIVEDHTNYKNAYVKKLIEGTWPEARRPIHPSHGGRHKAHSPDWVNPDILKRTKASAAKDAAKKQEAAEKKKKK